MNYHSRVARSFKERSLIEERSQAFLNRLDALRKCPPPPSEANHITIVGAGIAGLISAYELERLGFQVTILEADRAHIGGRVRTFRENDTTYGELGAMRIPAGHLLTRRYIREFGLQLRKFVQSSDDTFAYIRDTRSTRSQEGLEELKKQFELTDAEKGMSADDMWGAGVIDVLDELTEAEQADLYSSIFATKKIRELDGISLYTALQRAGLSQGAIEYVSSVYGVETYLNTAFTEHLREELERIWIDPFDEIVGGTDLLPQKIFNALNARVSTGARVYRIAQHDGTVTAFYYNSQGNAEQVSSDWLICTIPFGVLSTIDLSSAISDNKDWAIRRVNYDSSTKILVRCEKRFWELNDGIYGGGSIWDGGLGHTWYPSDNAEAHDPEVSKAPAYLLASYTWGQHARRIDSIPQAQLKTFVISELKKIHPKLDENDITRVIRWNWTNFHLSSGAFAFFNPDDHKTHYQDIKLREGKVLLAGEHCSLTHSWIQGAIESAIDAIEEILQKG